MVLLSAAAVPVESSAITTSNNDGTESLDFRQVPVHFGKNRGLLLSELNPQQLHWYEAEWMPKKEAQGSAADSDHALMAGLKAYREWREAEKRAEATATTVPRPKRQRGASKAADTVQAA